MLRIPSGESGRIEILVSRPRSWEFLLFGNVLSTGLERSEEKWRDFHLGYSIEVGRQIADQDLGAELSDRFSQVVAIASKLEHVIGPRAQQLAFGEEDGAGDPGFIEHTAGRVVRIYELLLGWADEFRSLRLPEDAEKLADLGAGFAAQPIEAIRQFIRDYVARLEAAIAELAAGQDTTIVIPMEITFTVDDEIADQFWAELRRVSKRLGVAEP